VDIRASITNLRVPKQHNSRSTGLEIPQRVNDWTCQTLVSTFPSRFDANTDQTMGIGDRRRPDDTWSAGMLAHPGAVPFSDDTKRFLRSDDDDVRADAVNLLAGKMGHL
jgi:hypothetical protein